MIHDGGWGQVDGEGKQRLRGDKCVCMCVFFDAVGECVNNKLQFMYLLKKRLQ